MEVSGWAQVNIQGALFFGQLLEVQRASHYVAAGNLFSRGLLLSLRGRTENVATAPVSHG